MGREVMGISVGRRKVKGGTQITSGGGGGGGSGGGGSGGGGSNKPKHRQRVCGCVLRTEHWDLGLILKILSFGMRLWVASTLIPNSSKGNKMKNYLKFITKKMITNLIAWLPSDVPKKKITVYSFEKLLGPNQKSNILFNCCFCVQVDVWSDHRVDGVRDPSWIGLERK